MRLAYRILRRYRGYLLPSHRKAFNEVVQRGAFQPGDENRNFVFFDFHNPEIDLDAGRYAFALVRDFELNGYTACYRPNFSFLSSMRHKRYKVALLEKNYRVAETPQQNTALVVTDRKGPADALRISYEHRQPRGDSEIVFPLKPFPGLYPHLDQIENANLDAARPWRCFFAGSVNKRYDRASFKKQFGKLSRIEMLDAVRPIARELKSLDQTFAAPEIVLASALRIPIEQWLPALSRADFFLACPGGAMPICHNVVEALAVGAIPILEYPEYLDPPLQDGVNCLAFQGRDGFVRTVARAKTISPPEIQKMRQACVAYYREHLAPGTFARRDLKGKTLLFNAHLAPRP